MHKKSRTLALPTKQAIWRFKQKNPTATIAEIAAKYDCSYDQARNAIKAGEKGSLIRSKPKKEDLYEPADDPDGDLEKEYARAVAALSAGDIGGAAAHTALLDKLVGVRKTLQQVRLQNHLRKSDAELIAAIIRRYEPEASDEEVIAIYKECAVVANMKRDTND